MPAAKKPAKAVDIIQAGEAMPSPTSRPVLVTSRPIITADPMLSAEKRSQVVEGERASGDPAGSVVPVGETAVSRQAKTLTPLSPKNTTAEPDVTEQESPGKGDGVGDEKDPPADANPRKPAQLHPVTTDEPAPDNDTTETTNADSDKAEEPPEEAVASDRELELERMIAAGTYFVPIGQAKRRRILLTVIVGTILLAVIALNLLLDMNILTLNLPHTNFVQ